jgi:transcription initiation factor TFIIIB Brf1 subunit/transcription initiation factor TFIIB
MIKECPKCGSKKLQWNSSHNRCKCKDCGWLWKRNRRGLELMIEEKINEGNNN